MTKSEAIKVLNNIESMFEQHEKDFEFAREKAALEMAIKSLQTPKRKTKTKLIEHRGIILDARFDTSALLSF